MGEVNSEIKRFHCPDYAYFTAFNIHGFGSSKSIKDAEDIYSSNDHSEFESSNPADTIPVATFLRNEKLPDEIIKKIYFYVCSFEWAVPIGEIKDSTDLEEIKKESKGPEIKKTCHLLFCILDESGHDEPSSWIRSWVDACENASSHKEAAKWMLNELTSKDLKVFPVDLFKKGTLEILI